MYSTLPLYDRDTSGRVATLLLGWHSLGEVRAHFTVVQMPPDNDRWLVVSCQSPEKLTSGGFTPNAAEVARTSRFIYHLDLPVQHDEDVRRKVERLYWGLEVGQTSTAVLGPRRNLAASAALPSALPERRNEISVEHATVIPAPHRRLGGRYASAKPYSRV